MSFIKNFIKCDIPSQVSKMFSKCGFSHLTGNDLLIATRSYLTIIIKTKMDLIS